VHHRRVATNHLAGVDHLVDRARVPELLATLLERAQDDTSDLASAVGVAPPEVLVCGHGRRDPCCGRWGTQVHAELLARGGAARVWRCSHTGGHRFAPTAITLPDGRAWADISADLLEGIVARTAPVAHLSPHDRGTSALDPWGQVVDRALFEQHGWAWLDVGLIEHRTQVAADGRSATVSLAWAGGGVDAAVEVVRDYPVLVCGEPPAAAKKTSPELALVELTSRA
jgi:hypothetical protein